LAEDRGAREQQESEKHESVHEERPSIPAFSSDLSIAWRASYGKVGFFYGGRHRAQPHHSTGY
jgi:hypothetical protein